MLINEQDVVLEAGVEMWLETQMNNDRVVMAIDVRINTVQTLEDLTDSLAKGLGKWNSCRSTRVSLCLDGDQFSVTKIAEWFTDTAWEGLFIVDIPLYPSHQVLNILRSGHLRGSLEVLSILPEVFEPRSIS
jgi:hypothetical protein